LVTYPFSRQGPRLGLQRPVHAAGAAGQLNEPVALDRALAGHGLLRLGDLLIDAAQAPAGPLGPVLVVDDLVPAPVGRPGRPGLDEHLPVADLPPGMVAPPLGHAVGNVGDAGADDERQPGILDGL
jgi:hypothetical protein